MSTSELIRFRCSGCQQLYQVSPTLAKERAKCRRCGQVFEIPASSAEALNVRKPRQALTDRPTAFRIAGSSETPARRRIWSAIIALGGCAALVSAIVFGTAIVQTDSRSAVRENLQRGRVARLSPPRSEFDFASVTELIDAVEPAVVCIKTNKGLGSGFVIDESGLIVTCFHCIDDVAGGRVAFKDQSEVPIVGVRRIAPERDLAVIQIAPTRPLIALPISHETPKKGEPVIALGSPAGLSFTVTEGSVSAVRTGEELSVLSREFVDAMSSIHWYHLSPTLCLVQITASTMPGSSGGPIVDFRGNVLGITSFGLNWHGQKLEFCISARDILDVVSQLDAKATPLHELPQLAPRNLLRPHNPWDGFPYKDLPSLPDPPPGPLAIQ